MSEKSTFYKAVLTPIDYFILFGLPANGDGMNWRPEKIFAKNHIPHYRVATPTPYPNGMAGIPSDTDPVALSAIGNSAHDSVLSGILPASAQYCTLYRARLCSLSHALCSLSRRQGLQ